MTFDFFEDDRGHGFQCPCGFLSEGWQSRALAEKRAEQHVLEHEEGTLMPPLSEVKL